MKRTGADSPKFKKLARLTGDKLRGARGGMEGLWHFTAKHAPRGDIGRWDDEDLADAYGWTLDDGPVSVLIEALVKSQLVDEHPEHRLVVHDWPEHADRHVHRAVMRLLVPFADGTLPRLYEGTEKERRAWGEKYPDKCGSGGGPTGGPRGYEPEPSQSLAKPEREEPDCSLVEQVPDLEQKALAYAHENRPDVARTWLAFWPKFVSKNAGPLRRPRDWLELAQRWIREERLEGPDPEEKFQRQVASANRTLVEQTGSPLAPDEEAELRSGTKVLEILHRRRRRPPRKVVELADRIASHGGP